MPAWTAVAGIRSGERGRELYPGDVFSFPEVKHGHGVAADRWLSHPVQVVPGENCFDEWMATASDEEYGKLGCSFLSGFRM